MDNHHHNHPHNHTHSEEKHSHTHKHDKGICHEHEHVHSADAHTHEHNHQHHAQEFGNDELYKLNILLDHWVNHNEDHGKEFSEWSEKAAAMGKSETAQAIMDAVSYIKKANEALVTAKEKM